MNKFQLHNFFQEAVTTGVTLLAMTIVFATLSTLLFAYGMGESGSIIIPFITVIGVVILPLVLFGNGEHRRH